MQYLVVFSCIEKVEFDLGHSMVFYAWPKCVSCTNGIEKLKLTYQMDMHSTFQIYSRKEAKTSEKHTVSNYYQKSNGGNYGHCIGQLNINTN